MDEPSGELVKRGWGYLTIPLIELVLEADKLREEKSGLGPVGVRVGVRKLQAWGRLNK